MQTQTPVDSTRIRARIAQLQDQIIELQDQLADVTLSESDIAAIKAGHTDFREGRTRSL